MPEQDWNNLKFNIERALPSPDEHEHIALEAQVHDLANRIRTQMAMNEKESCAYNLFPEVVKALENKGFKVSYEDINTFGDKEYKIQWW